MRICFGLILRVFFAKVHKAKSGCFGRSNRLEVIKALRRGRGNDVCESASVDVILVLPLLFFALLVWGKLVPTSLLFLGGNSRIDLIRDADDNKHGDDY